MNDLLVEDAEMRRFYYLAMTLILMTAKNGTRPSGTELSKPFRIWDMGRIDAREVKLNSYHPLLHFETLNAINQIKMVSIVMKCSV